MKMDKWMRKNGVALNDCGDEKLQIPSLSFPFEHDFGTQRRVHTGRISGWDQLLQKNVCQCSPTSAG